MRAAEREIGEAQRVANLKRLSLEATILGGPGDDHGPDPLENLVALGLGTLVEVVR